MSAEVQHISHRRTPGCDPLLRRRIGVPADISDARSRARTALALYTNSNIVLKPGERELPTDSVEVVVTELGSNALREARHYGVDSIRLIVGAIATCRADVDAEAMNRRIVVKVFDPNPHIPELPNPKVESARGLLVVTKLADSMGFSPVHDGKWAWAVLPSMRDEQLWQEHYEQPQQQVGNPSDEIIDAFLDAFPDLEKTG